jgi:hypothetical protein
MLLMGTKEELEREPVECDRCLFEAEEAEARK